MTMHGSEGVYHNLRLVLDVADTYYPAAEYMDCRGCGGTYIAWDQRILDQLPEGVRARFPVVLTRKYACDSGVISFLHARTLGNSPTAMRHNLQELHSESYLRRVVQYLHDSDRYRSQLQKLHLPVPEVPVLPAMAPFRLAKWFLAAYVRDVWERLPMLKAAITSIFGTVLKTDSTKKVCKKLQGSAGQTAAWATDVGNERGEVLMSLLAHG